MYSLSKAAAITHNSGADYSDTMLTYGLAFLTYRLSSDLVCLLRNLPIGVRRGFLVGIVRVVPCPLFLQGFKPPFPAVVTES
jgi:hypothetical protein